MIHTRNKISITREQLQEIPLVTPNWASSRWKGVEHGELVKVIAERLEQHQVKIKGEEWFVGGLNNGNLNGYMRLNLPKITAPAGMDFCLGVMHSNNGISSLKFAVGAQVFICSNGMVRGEFVLKRKHTTGLELDETVGAGIERYLTESSAINKQVEGLQERGLSDADSDAVLMRAGRNGIMPWARIGQVDQEYRKPTFADFKARNAWSLYNAFTYVAQKSPSHSQIGMSNRFMALLNAPLN